MKKRILCVEDEAPIRQMLQYSLERDGYLVIEAETATEARNAVAEQLPDLMLIDWMLPDMSGPELIKRFRADDITRDTPIIMLTARTEEEDMIKGLDAGADDYLPKPVSLKHLSARINALFRRTSGFSDTPDLLTFGKISLNVSNHQLRVDGDIIELGITEFRLLEFFMQHPDRVYSRTQLLDFVWGQNTFIEERSVDVYILRLRKHLKKYQLERYIRTVRGVGYRFTLEGLDDE